jgi:hypothetical protein
MWISIQLYVQSDPKSVWNWVRQRPCNGNVGNICYYATTCWTHFHGNAWTQQLKETVFSIRSASELYKADTPALQDSHSNKGEGGK